MSERAHSPPPVAHKSVRGECSERERGTLNRCQTIVDFLGERSDLRGKKEANRVIEDPERVLLVGVICFSRAHGFLKVSAYLLLDPASGRTNL